MPPLPTLKINEIFSSLQGEGLRQGEPTIFIRLSGCNLRCSFCDTRYAWGGGQDMTFIQIKEQVGKIHQDFPADWICFTGGEPLLQNIQPLLQELKDLGHQLQIETNATLLPAAPVDWYTVSPKPPHYDFHPDFKGLAKEIKIIVTQDLALSTLRRLRQEFPANTPLLLQPESNGKEAMQKGIKLTKQALLAGLKNIRLSIQLHKIYGWP